MCECVAFVAAETTKPKGVGDAFPSALITDTAVYVDGVKLPGIVSNSATATASDKEPCLRLQVTFLVSSVEREDLS